ncbi:DNA-protecting protein DprA [Candidatus Microgenomates bacterium]|nr:DNA-protecting protein DprA [Candidatus Microgenomates bacterium]
MSSEEKLYWLFFSAFEEGIGPVRFQLLLKHFGCAKNAWSAKLKDLLEAGLPVSIAQKFVKFRSGFSQDNYLKLLKNKTISFITLSDIYYPPLLKQISDPPFVLYLKGNYQKQWFLDETNIAVVGSRKATAYGREVTTVMTKNLVEAGLTIVSGLALGIDSVAHQAALNKQGKTIAVLGCGVDLIYPSQNRKLYEEIINKGGCIISEMPLGHWVSKTVFPARNRIISGLSKGVLITEGAVDSGALITCSYAAEQGRDVFAVPGPIDSFLSEGPHSLLKKGARLVTSAKDILEELKITPPGCFSTVTPGVRSLNKKDFSDDERTIMDLLKTEQLTVDDIIKKSHLSSSIVLSVLSFLEIKGYIRDYGGKYRIQ